MGPFATRDSVRAAGRNASGLPSATNRIAGTRETCPVRNIGGHHGYNASAKGAIRQKEVEAAPRRAVDPALTEPWPAHPRDADLAAE